MEGYQAKVNDKGALLRGPDGQRQNVDTKPCFECHKPESAKDYVFTLNELRFRGQ
jgi:hypothetical protein